MIPELDSTPACRRWPNIPSMAVLGRLILKSQPGKHVAQIFPGFIHRLLDTGIAGDQPFVHRGNGDHIVVFPFIQHPLVQGQGKDLLDFIPAEFM